MSAPDVPPQGSASPDEHRRRGGDGGRELALDESYEPINASTVRRAVVLLLKARAEVLEESLQALHSERSSIARPFVIRLTSYVRVPRDAHRRKITRRAVFARDDWTCQYCGARSNLTVDHVIPRSKGGPSSWDNIVASCAPCNRRKGDRTPAQAGRGDLLSRVEPDDPAGVARVHAGCGVAPPPVHPPPCPVSALRCAEV